MTEPTVKHREEARAIRLPFPCGCLDAHSGGGMTVEEFTCEAHNAIATALSSRDREVREVLEGRLAYIESKDLRNGWSGNESGPCCQKCQLRDEHFTGRADFLKAAAGCRNPFQLPEACQCHVPVRQAVKNGQVEILKQVLTALDRL